MVERVKPGEYFKRREEEPREGNKRGTVNTPSRRSSVRWRPPRGRLMQGGIRPDLMVLGIVGMVAMVAIAGVVIAVKT